MITHWAFLSIGSNMGDPLRNCCKGIEDLIAGGHVTVEKRSPFYWTEPVDFTAQQWFINAALKVTTSLEPLDLLAKMQSIQSSSGRIAGGVRFGPRPLDLDIIFFEDWIIDTPELVIPHPRMHKRHFVLQPICDIDPEVNHPVLHLKVNQLLDQLDKEGQRIRPCYYDC